MTAGFENKRSTISGVGDVVGPASSTDNAVARFDGATGKIIQDSAVTIADTTGDITGGKYNTVAISGTSTPTLAVSGTTAVSGANTGDQTISDATITTSDISTNNVSTLKHGFTPKLSGNALQFLNGQGNYTTPTAGVANSYSLTTFTSQTSVNVTHNFGTYPNVQVINGSGAVLIPLTITNNTVNDFTVTFIASTSGSIIATVGSPQPQALTTVTNDYTVLTTDRIIQCTSAGKTITLPTAVGNAGREFILKNSSNGDIYLKGNGSELIDNLNIQTISTFSAITVYSNGASYYII